MRHKITQNVETYLMNKMLNMKCLFFLLILFSGCVSPNAVKLELATVRDNLNKLESLIDNKANTKIVAGIIDDFRQEINQNLLSINKTMNNSGSIQYGGGGWIVVGTGVIAVIFVGAGLLLVRAFLKRSSMLTLLTRAIRNAGENDPDLVRVVKRHLKKCVIDSDSIEETDRLEQDRKNLGDFTKKMGTFAEQKA